MRGRAAILLLVVLLAGCGLFSKKKVPLPGMRISVLTLDRNLRPDPQLAKIPITLPRPYLNKDWPQAGGFPDHAMYHLSLPYRLARAWSVSVGAGDSDNSQILSAPVVAHGRVYAMDGRDRLGAYDSQTGRRLWRVSLKPKGEEGNGFGGGVAYWKGRLFAATGYAQVLAINPANGKVIWRKDVSAPVHSAPTVADGRVFVATVENELDVFSAKDGRSLWSHTGLPETANLLGGASPAVAGEVVVFAQSSGELDALAVENGRLLWSHNLAGAESIDAVSSIADIRGRPVIDRDRVFATNYSGRTIAVDLRNGERVWDQPIGSLDGPWVAGDYLYLLSTDDQLLCLTRNDGKVRWIVQLPRYEDPEGKSGLIVWSGPVLGSNRLVLVASNGEALAVSPYTGEPLGRQPIASGAFLEPIVANNTLYILTNDGTLSAYR